VVAVGYREGTVDGVEPAFHTGERGSDTGEREGAGAEKSYAMSSIRVCCARANSSKRASVWLSPSGCSEVRLGMAIGRVVHGYIVRESMPVRQNSTHTRTHKRSWV
jgi:hypothetical protein